MNEWVQYFIAPLVTAIVTAVVLSGLNYFLLPRREAEARRRVELFLQRQEIYAEALRVVDAHLNQSPLAALGSIFARHLPIGDPVSVDRVNEVLGRLRTVCADETIPNLFAELLSGRIDGEILVTRGKLVRAVRQELHGDGKDIEPKDVPFYQHTGPPTGASGTAGPGT